jgi:KUP system potassium uptake protein
MTADNPHKAGLPTLGLAALGVVFGDIGTSPLYTLKTVIDLSGGAPTPEVLLGVVSLIFWTLTIVVTVKYVCVAMSMNNDGEGGSKLSTQIWAISVRGRSASLGA